MRLIDADALEKKLHELALNEWNQRTATSWSNAFLECEDIVYNAPTIEPKQGHWITWFENEDVRQAKCSECGMMFTLGKGRDIHYCGNCGAKMDEVKE